MRLFLLPFRTDTKVQGWSKRELEDHRVSNQLWIITRIGDSDEFRIRNATSRTCLDLRGSMSCIIFCFIYTCPFYPQLVTLRMVAAVRKSLGIVRPGAGASTGS